MSHITTNNRMLLTYMFSNYFRPPNIAICGSVVHLDNNDTHRIKMKNVNRETNILGHQEFLSFG